MEKIYLDAENIPMGRLASFAAKQALLGNNIFVLNCEKAIISGNREATIRKIKQKRARGGSALKGPYTSKDTEKMVKRSIRGMLPNFRRGRGREAWKRIRCYNGIQEEFKKEKITKLKINIPIKNINLQELKKII